MGTYFKKNTGHKHTHRIMFPIKLDRTSMTVLLLQSDLLEGLQSVSLHSLVGSNEETTCQWGERTTGVPLKSARLLRRSKLCQRGQNQLWCPRKTLQRLSVWLRGEKHGGFHTPCQSPVSPGSPLRILSRRFSTPALKTLGGTRKKTRQRRGQLRRKRDNSGKQADKHKLTRVMRNTHSGAERTAASWRHSDTEHRGPQLLVQRRELRGRGLTNGWGRVALDPANRNQEVNGNGRKLCLGGSDLKPLSAVRKQWVNALSRLLEGTKWRDKHHRGDGSPSNNGYCQVIPRDVWRDSVWIDQETLFSPPPPPPPFSFKFHPSVTFLIHILSWQRTHSTHLCYLPSCLGFVYLTKQMCSLHGHEAGTSCLGLFLWQQTEGKT